MPLTILLGVLTLTPAVCTLAIAALGLARRALPPAVLALVAVGVLVPAICLLVLAPYLASGEPLRLTLFGGVTGPAAWFSPVYRADAFSLYAGLGLAFLVAPVLLWLAWQGPSVAGRQMAGDGGDIIWALSPTGLARAKWGSVALALGAETAALTLLFADNILWLGLSWVVLAALAWSLGEVGAGDTVDRAGLAFALAGPLLWTGAMLVGAVPARAPTFYDLMGRGSYTVIEVVLLALTLALASGAYPFAVWVRRRGVLAAPAGVAAVTLALVPIALYVGSRTYSAAQDAGSSWPAIGKATPPITAGIAFALLGAITVGSAGLLALERRSIRAMLASLAVAQVGWGFLALGTGNPGSILGLTLLLATAVFGLGAMICAAFAGGTLGDEDEREGAGPRPFGAPASTPNLIAWCAGAVALIGAPLFCGFVSRQMISAAALSVGNLTVPLVGLAWAGDGLLAIALLRLTAPAFTAIRSRPKVELEAEYQATALALDGTAVPASAGFAASAAVEGENRARAQSSDADFTDADFTTEEMTDADADEEEEDAPVATMQPNDLRELPGLIFAVLALVVGIAPQLLLNFGGMLAAGELAQAGAVDTTSHALTLGYTAGPGQWLASLAWLALVVLGVALLLLRPGGSRAVKPVLLAGQSEADIADSAAPELAGMAEPLDAWSDIAPTFTSPLTLPAGEWLLPSAAALEHLDHDVDVLDEPEVEGAEDASDETAGQSTVVVEADDVYEPSNAGQLEDAAPTNTVAVAPQPETVPEMVSGLAGEAEDEVAPAADPEFSPGSAEASDEPPAPHAEPAPAQAQADASAESPAEEFTEESAEATSATPDAPSHAASAAGPAQSPETVATRVNGRTNNQPRSGNQSRSGNRGRSGKSGRAGKKGGR